MKVFIHKLGCLLIMVFSAVVTFSCANAQRNEKNPVSVKVQKIQFTDEQHPQVFIGRVEAGKSSLISASSPGRIVGINVRKGQRISKGCVMATIDSPTIKSLYETAKATFDQASDGLRRVEDVYKTGSVSEVKYVEVKTSCAKAEAALNAARAALDGCTIRAPYDGVVSEIMAEEGTEVLSAAPLFRFLDVSTVEIRASVPENEYSAYSIGQKADVVIDAVEYRSEAVLKSKGFEASSLSHSYDFVFQPGSRGKMMPGMVCKVYMTPSAIDSSVVIPSSAVRVDSEGRYVWCLDSLGAVVKKHIVAREFADDGIIVESGLSNGDLLVTEGGRNISTGMTNIRIDECR